MESSYVFVYYKMICKQPSRKNLRTYCFWIFGEILSIRGAVIKSAMLPGIAGCLGRLLMKTMIWWFHHVVKQRWFGREWPSWRYPAIGSPRSAAAPGGDCLTFIVVVCESEALVNLVQALRIFIKEMTKRKVGLQKRACWETGLPSFVEVNWWLPL